VRRLLAPVVFGLLVGATLGAFVYAQNRKSEPLVIDRVFFGFPDQEAKPRNVFTPNGDGCLDRGRIRFRTTSRDRGSVEVITPEGELVRTLAPDTELEDYRYSVFFWNGRDDEGARAPAGPYKLRVRFFDQDRSLIPGGRLRVHDVPPREPACGAPPQRAGR